MHNIYNVIELKRGIYKICSQELMEEIASVPRFENFYKDIFELYNVKYDTETIKQKRTFVAAITKYFIIDRLPKDELTVDDAKYSYMDSDCYLKKDLQRVVDDYFIIRQESSSNLDFIQRYSKIYEDGVIKDFSKEISENREDSLSVFSKVVEKLYYSKDED